REQQGAGRQNHGGLEAAQYLAEHGPLHPERAAEIALQHAAHLARVLHGQLLVEAERGAQPRDVLVGGLRPGHDLGGIAGRGVEDGDNAKRRGTSPSTGRFIQSERPRSPCSTRPIQRAYCTGSGSSRPSSVRSRVMSSWVACGPSMISAGSPGEMWRTAKTTSDTPSRTG